MFDVTKEVCYSTVAASTIINLKTSGHAFDDTREVLPLLVLLLPGDSGLQLVPHAGIGRDVAHRPVY
jgi:hypothetical protein